ncbi:MAG TPA: SAM-dependent methyltransferase [Gammaproteobacteria bacterium]|nr:SAM-dependent methyltransferase [Gammaproteobacteria bacterium]
MPPLSPNTMPPPRPERPPGERRPAPTAAARARSDALLARIREEIGRAGGALGFSRYMEMALYTPGLGYYSGGAAKLGPAGDFVTAPEVSALFGRCVARQALEALAAIGGGEVLELGGGSGALAEAALAEACDGLRWHMLEPSAELRDRQRARLGERVCWHDTLPRGFRGVIVANEVADALPVERFTIRDGEPRRLGVGVGDAGLEWTLMAPEPAFAGVVHALEIELGQPFPEGYSGEFCPMLQAWVRSLAACLDAGLLLLIDYGLPRRELYAAERVDGTLICHYRHRAHADPFLWPGLQDISAWVDFTAIAEAATDAGLTLEGYTTQAAFLAGNGLEHMLQAGAGDAAAIRLAQEAKRLLLPGEMGERFRVMGLSRGLGPALAGFRLRDLAGRL